MSRIVVCFAVLVALNLGGMASAEPITAKRAHDLAATYLLQYISLCGVVEAPISRSTYWELPIRVGQASEPAGAIQVDKRTGRVSYPNHPIATPLSLAAWEKSLEKRGK
jgi:hypothetical protein